MEENGHVTEVDRLREGEWSCYCGHCNVRENGHVTEVVGLKKGEWSLSRWLFNGGGMVMLERWLAECIMVMVRWPV